MQCCVARVATVLRFGSRPGAQAASLVRPATSPFGFGQRSAARPGSPVVSRASNLSPAPGPAPAPSANNRILTVLGLVVAFIGLLVAIFGSALALNMVLTGTLADLKANITESRADLKASFAELKADVKADNADVKASMAEFKADVKADNADVKQQLGKAEERWLTVAQEGSSERRLVDFLKEQQIRTLEPPAVKVGRE